MQRASLPALLKAFLELREALRARWHARSLAVVEENEAFRRSQPIYYHDRYSAFEPTPRRPRVLFVCPYALWPPIHGGSISIHGTVAHLREFAETHLIILCETPEQVEEQRQLKTVADSVTPLLRRTAVAPRLGSMQPHAVHEFQDENVAWVD